MPICVRCECVPMHARECLGVPGKHKGALVSNAWKRMNESAR